MTWESDAAGTAGGNGETTGVPSGLLFNRGLLVLPCWFASQWSSISPKRSSAVVSALCSDGVAPVKKGRVAKLFSFSGEKPIWEISYTVSYMELTRDISVI